MSAPDANGWFLIPAEVDVSAAPFDGVPVILGWIDHFHPRSAWWARGWTFASGSNGNIGIAPSSPQPTHWQPLPAPPVQS